LRGGPETNEETLKALPGDEKIPYVGKKATNKNRDKHTGVRGEKNRLQGEDNVWAKRRGKKKTRREG